jgi:hypothetical protein
MKEKTVMELDKELSTMELVEELAKSFYFDDDAIYEEFEEYE